MTGWWTTCLKRSSRSSSTSKKHSQGVSLWTSAAAGFASLLLAASPVIAEDERQWRHGGSLFGELKYSEGFTHFDYVNPDAPKGGRARLASLQRFDSLNPVPERGSAAPGLQLTYDTLMTSALDEASAEYGLVAEAFWYPDDYSSAVYRLRPEARWHDGQPITAEDVVWSFNQVTDKSPFYRQYYSSVTAVEATGEHEITFTFNQSGNRELPKIVGQFTIYPKHWWTATDAEGNPRDIGRTTLEPPLGSGPYRIKSTDTGRSIVYERVEDYWAADLNVNVGKNNFDEIEYKIYFDDTVLREAFKADEFDFRDENSSSRWATVYDMPELETGEVVKEIFPDNSRGVMQGFGFNLRREKFQDWRVRRALNYAWDFETINETISFGLLSRTYSYFSGTELAATGLPEGLELEILETVRGEIPETVFTEEYTNPVGGSPQAMRSNLREAIRLFREAGYELQDGAMVNTATGEPFSFEFVSNFPGADRTFLPFQQELEKIGVASSLRIVDTSQFINRRRAFDFDVMTVVWGQSLSPGNEQLGYWGSQSADQPGSRNFLGIKDPAIDKLIDRIIYAQDREELVAATRALDRVLLHHHFVVPQFYVPESRTIRWNRFGHPETIPLLSYGFPTIWWYDAQLAQAIEEGN